MSDESSHAGTLFIVDDEPPLLRLMVRILERAHYRVISARDGDEAVALFAKHRDEVDAVVLDVVIPPAGAAPVMEALRELKPGVPLLLSSGDLLAPRLQEELDRWGGSFLRKPYVPESLERAIEVLLDPPDPQ